MDRGSLLNKPIKNVIIDLQKGIIARFSVSNAKIIDNAKAFIVAKKMKLALRYGIHLKASPD